MQNNVDFKSGKKFIAKFASKFYSSNNKTDKKNYTVNSKGETAKLTSVKIVHCSDYFLIIKRLICKQTFELFSNYFHQFRCKDVFITSSINQQSNGPGKSNQITSEAILQKPESFQSI